VNDPGCTHTWTTYQGSIDGMTGMTVGVTASPPITRAEFDELSRKIEEIEKFLVRAGLNTTSTMIP
jgi:hypothetical protein